MAKGDPLRIGLLLTRPLLVRNWLSSGLVATLQARHEVTLYMPQRLIEAARPWVPQGVALVATDRAVGGAWRRRVREVFLLASMVHREPRSATYRHKLAQRRPLGARLEIRALRRLRDRGVDLEAAFRRWEARRPPVRAARLLLRPLDVLLWPTLLHTHNEEVELIKSARGHPCRVVAAPASWDTLSCKGAFLLPPDHLLVWGEASYAHAVDGHGFLPSSVTVTGPPHWDGYADAHPLDTLAGKPTILVVGTSVNFWSDEHRLLTSLGRSGLREGFRVLFRPHPRGAWGWHFRDLLPTGVSLDPQIEHWVAHGRRGWSLDPADLAYYPRLMASVSCVVAAFSTMVVEAALLGTPSFLVAFGASRHGPGGAIRHLAYEHMRDIARWPGISVCQTEGDLLDRVTASLGGGLAHERRALQMAAQGVARVDGRAQQRILEAVECLRP